MIRVIALLLFVYLIALHCSIAAMEIVSWVTIAGALAYKIKSRAKFEFPLWPWLIGLSLATLFSLVANPALKPFWYQMGFMRWIFLLWGLYWALDLVWSREFEKKLATLWIWLLPVVACNALFQFVTGIDLFHRKGHVDLQGSLYRATGFFSMSLTFAYVMGISYFSILLPSRRQAKEGLFWLVAVSGAICLVASGSRGAWIAAILTGFVYVAVALRKWLPHFVVAVVAGLGLLSFVSPKFNSLMHLRLEWSSAVRLQIWRAYFEMFLDHPLTGVGIFQGDKLLPQYYARHDIREAFVSHAHNVLLQWLGGAGLFGFVCYVVISAKFLRMAWRMCATTAWGWSLLLAQIFFHMGGLTEANFFDGEVNHFIVFSWALLLTLAKRHKGEK